MFSWICPQCGRDVPPTKTDCPFCAEQAAAMAAAVPQGVAVTPESQPATPWQQQPAPGYGAPPAWPPAPQGLPQQAPPPPYAPPAMNAQAAPPPYAPPQQYQPPQPAPPYHPQQNYAPPPSPPPQLHATPHPAPAPWAATPARSGPPTWVAALGFALVLILVGGGIWFFVLRDTDSGSSSTKAAAASPTASAAAGQAAANPYQKYVEVVGIRMITEDKKPVAKFVVVNHSAAEIDNLEANVRLSASTSRSEEDSVGSFSFKIPELAANSSKDMTAPLKTKLKMYELPDWQKTNVEVELTSPTQ